MNWEAFSVPGARKVGQQGSDVIVRPVQQPIRGDVNLTQLRMWGARHGGASYMITFDEMHPALAYSASVKARGKKHPTFLVRGVATFAEAERACVMRARQQRPQQ